MIIKNNLLFLTFYIFLILIICTVNIKPQEISNRNNNSEVDNPPIVIDSPISTSIWKKGYRYTIQWTDDTGGTATIDLYKGGSFLQTLATNISTYSGYGFWRFYPDFYAIDSDYQIKVTSYQNNANYAFSDFFSIEETTWDGEIILTPSDGNGGGKFAGSVAISGDYAIVGNDFYNQQGKVYIYHWDGATWVEQQKLVASDASNLAHFGASVDISGDYAIVGAWYAAVIGKAYIFKRNGTTWTEEAILTSSDGTPASYFGWSVSIDGNYAIVGTYENNTKAAYIFSRSGTTWTEEKKLTPGSGGTYAYGESVSISGNKALVGDKSDNTVYVYVKAGTNWTQEAILTPYDGASGIEFGSGVAIENDYLIIGAQLGHKAYIFYNNGTNWADEDILMPSDGTDNLFGSSVNINNGYVIVGASGDYFYAGGAYIFKKNASNWVEETKITASNWTLNSDQYGITVSISGDNVIVGAPYNGTGKAYVYNNTASNTVSVTIQTSPSGLSFSVNGTSYTAPQTFIWVSGEAHTIATTSPQGNGSDTQYLWSSWSDGGTINHTVAPTTNITYTANFNTQYYLTMHAGTGGSVTPASGWQNGGDVVVITATPNSEYNFNTWTGSGSGSYSGSSDVATITMNVPITETATFTSTTNWTEVDKIFANDGAADDNFGNYVSISGDYMIVGSQFDDDYGDASGSAYIYHKLGNDWVQEIKLIPDDGAANDQFGNSAAISGDYAIVGAHFDDDNETNSGSVYIFKRSGTNWTQEVKLHASNGAANDNFGWSVSISGDYVIIGAVSRDAAYIFHRSGSSWTEETILLDDDGNTNDEFGFSVSISGTDAIVGAAWDDDNGNASGSAYIFTYNGSNWVQEAKLLASNGAANDIFGFSVSISGDYATVGASQHNENGNNSGTVYIFKRGVVNSDIMSWVEQNKLLPNDGAADDYFGYSVSISGNDVIVGAYGDDDNGNESGSSYIFNYDGSSWTQKTKLRANDGADDDWFGRSVSISSSNVLVGTPNNGTGKAYIFNNPATNLISVTVQTNPSGLSFSVDGTSYTTPQTFNWGNGSSHTIATTSPQSGGTGIQYIWSSWSDGGTTSHTVAPTSNTTYTANFNTQYYLTMTAGTGGSVTPSSGWINSGENMQITAVPNSGYIFTDWTGSGSGSYTGINNPATITMNGPITETGAFANSTNWQQIEKLLANDGASNDNFGVAVSISGNYVIIGAQWDSDNGSSSGSAYIFKREESNWTQEAKLLADDGSDLDAFGYSVSISGDYCIIGAYGDDDNGSFSGSAYIFKRNGTNWIQEVKLLPNDGTANDAFGSSVSISGDYAIVGAWGNADNGSYSGSAYIFKREGSSWTQEAKLLAIDGYYYAYFGSSVSISGDYVVVGAHGDNDNGSSSGSAYIFKRDGINWIQEAKLLANDGAPDDHFGISVSISGNYVVVGAHGDNDNGSSSGSAYIFEREETNWIQKAKLLANDGAANDLFGESVSILGDYCIIGAYGDDDNGSSSGSAYIFKREGTSWIQKAKLLANDGAASDNFGYSLSITIGYAIVGARYNNGTAIYSGSAYIFQGPSINNILLLSKVLLQGCYNSGSMSALLNTQGVLPLVQPYNTTPWNYNGTESVTSIPSADIVDWVLVELRTGTTADTKIATRAAFLKTDGTTVDLDGTSPLSFSGIAAGDYYVVIRHRNHIPIMSAAPVTFATGTAANYDFTTSQSMAYGTNAMMDLGDGNFGLIAGDENASGDFSSIDALKVKVAIHGGSTGYLNEDINLSGDMSSIDYLRVKVGISNGYSVQFPE